MFYLLYNVLCTRSIVYQLKQVAMRKHIICNRIGDKCDLLSKVENAWKDFHYLSIKRYYNLFRNVRESHRGLCEYIDFMHKTKVHNGEGSCKGPFFHFEGEFADEMFSICLSIAQFLISMTFSSRMWHSSRSKMFCLLYFH